MHQGTRLPSALHKVEKSVVTALQGKLGTRSARFAEGQFHTTVFPSLRPASRREVSELDGVLSRLLAEHSADYGGDEGGEDARPECLSGKSDGGGDGHPPRNSAWGTPRNGCNDGSGRVAGPRSGDEEESGVGEESTSLPEGFEDVTKLLDLSQEEEHVYDMCFHECIRQVRTRYVRVGVALCRAGWVACMSRRTCLAQCLLGERDERGHLTVQQYGGAPYKVQLAMRPTTGEGPRRRGVGPGPWVSSAIASLVLFVVGICEGATTYSAAL